MTTLFESALITFTLLQALPVLCIPGYQSSEGSTECSPCPAGFGCPLSSDPTLNFACTSGLYSPEGERVCLSCPAGSACPNTSVSVVCEAGTFSLEGYTVCEPCPAGWACSYTDGHGNAPCTLVSVYTLYCTVCLYIYAVYKLSISHSLGRTI